MADEPKTAPLRKCPKCRRWQTYMGLGPHRSGAWALRCSACMKPVGLCSC